MDNEKMIENIRILCKIHEISITKLEEELGFSQGLISRWKDKTPSIDKIIDIADYFRISLDYVAGYHSIVDDKFLEKLITQTTNKSIKWSNYDNSDEKKPKQYYNTNFHRTEFIDQNDVNDYLSTHNTISYFSKINNGYISLYGCYEYHNILNPSDIKIFIQPEFEAQLIEQNYSCEQLKILWLKVLYSMGDKAPDEIKAEEFKNSFINDFKKPPLSQKKKIIFVSNPNRPRPQTPKKREPSNHIPELYVSILNEIGCVLYDIGTHTIIDKDEEYGVTDVGKKFYFNHKESLGKIIKAEMINGEQLLLVSTSKIMKLSGFSWGENRGNVGFAGLLEILEDAGFDKSNEALRTQDTLTIEPQ